MWNIKLIVVQIQFSFEDDNKMVPQQFDQQLINM